MTMRSFAEVAEQLRKRCARERAQWAQDVLLEGREPQQRLTLRASKREACADIVAYERWERAWIEMQAHHGGVRIEWQAADWSEIGRAQRPVAVVINTLEATFALMQDGERERAVFERAMARIKSVSPEMARALLAEARFVFEADDAAFNRLHAVVQWLLAHRRADCFVREMPIEGVDTKWFESNRALVARLLTQLLGLETPLLADDVACRWRIRFPDRLFRVRHAHRIVAGLAPEDVVQLPASVLSRVPVERVCVMENVQTGLSIDVPDDVLIVCGAGAGIVEIAQVTWISQAQICYMGDLDQHGLIILAALRRQLPQVRSTLMDVATLNAYAHLAVIDPTQALSQPEVGLMADEAALFAQLAAKRWRLEQERIPIARINAALRAL